MKRSALGAAIAAAALLTSQAAAQRSAANDGPPNFDIRLSQAAAGLVGAAAAPGGSTFGGRDATLARLAADVQGALQISDSPELGTTEIVGVSGGPRFLTGPSGDRLSTMRQFMVTYADAYGLTADEIARLVPTATYANPGGNMAWVELEQRVNGLPVFRGSIRGGFTRLGHLARTTGTIVPGLDGATLPVTPALGAAEAVSRAAAEVGWRVAPSALVERGRSGGTVILDRADMAANPDAWLLYFPMAPAVARLAWASVIWGDRNSFLSVVDANDGTLLFRKNLTNRQTQTATYAVYLDDSPAPMSPSTALPGSGLQAPFISRTPRTLVGNEPPFSFNLLGWMTDGTNLTDGNNVEAGIDRDGVDGVDAPVAGSARVFNFAFNPVFEAPTSLNYQRGEVTDVFYWSNWYHDRLYQLGFTEAAGNFQHDNFGRGGVAGDRVRAESQDSSDVLNADFTTPPDGIRPRMQMFLFTGPSPARSAGLDHDVLLHELTHGTSNRLHQNAMGLTSQMAGGLGEGWSDFFARALLSTPDEDPNGIYTSGGWITHRIFELNFGPFLDNYYYGSRRFPYAVKTTVGANGRSHNPLTFADIDPSQALIVDSAFPRSPVAGGNVFLVHNSGEVWAMALFEIRARFIARLGHDVGNHRILQFVLDGMKLDPANPTFLQARDAILAAAMAGGGTPDDLADIWAGFATRGMGFSARVLNPTVGSVIEAFDLPGITAAGGSLVAEQFPNGRIDPGEQVTVSLCLSTAGVSASGIVNASLQATGGVASPSGPQNYGTVAPAGTVCRSFTFTAGPSATCGHFVVATLQVQEAGLPERSLPFLFDVGSVTTFFTESFDAVAAPALPAGWTTATLSGTANPWGTRAGASDAGPQHAFAASPDTPSDAVLVSPAIALPGGPSRVTFRHAVNVESTFDAGFLEISIGGGPFQDVITAGGSFVTGGYSGTFSPNTALGPRGAWIVNTAGYITTSVNLPASAAGQSIVLRWRFVTDEFLGIGGWSVDSIALQSFQCSNLPPTLARQPQSSTIAFSEATTLNVIAGGTAPLSFQWYQGVSPNTTVPIAGATSASFTTPSLTGSASYWVRVSNGFGFVNSNTATITVLGLGQATYASARKAPACTLVSGVCDSGSLLTGRGAIAGGPEPNQPNTINNSCPDGSNGAFHQEESIDRITVATLTGAPFMEGAAVRITATAYIWQASVDRVDFFVSANADIPLWTHLSTVIPAGSGIQTMSADYVLSAGSVQAVRVIVRAGGSAAPCVPGSFNDHDDLVFPVGINANSELVQNGAFTNGLDRWSLFEVPDIVHNAGTGGVFRYHKADPITTGSGQAVIFQQTQVSVPAETSFSAQFDLGNLDAVRKRISVLVLDGDFSDLSVCTFWLEPGAPLRTYRMNSHATKPWTNTSIYFYAASTGTGDYALDNVSLKVDPSGSLTRTDCVDPSAPVPPGGPNGPNLLANGDFTSGLLPWGAFFDITWQLSGGVLEFLRPGTPGVPAGGFLQPTSAAMTAGQIMTASFDLGNSSAVRKRVSVLVHDLDFTDLAVCTFWLAPNQPLSTYSMRSTATKPWTNATLSVYAATTGPESWTRLDNVALARTPGLSAVGTECIEPVPGPIALPLTTARAVEPAVTLAGPPAVTTVVTRGMTSWSAEAWTTRRDVLRWIGGFDLTEATTAALTFDSRLSSRASTALVEISRDGSTWHTLTVIPPTPDWTPVHIDLTPFVGGWVDVRLVFDGVASNGVAADTWSVENLLVTIDDERRAPATGEKRRW